MSTITLTKHHGLGNDFLVAFHPEVEDLPALARRLCDRRRGIGADGLLVGESEMLLEGGLLIGAMEPATMQGYDRCPRSLAERAEAYLKSTGIADNAFFGPENEFFVFDHVAWDDNMQGAFYKVDSDEGAWNTNRSIDEGNTGHRPTVKGGYFPVPPVDSLHDIRSAMCLALEELGLTTEVHHHEVATAGQCEIGVQFNTLVRKADEVQTLKYVVHNVAHAYGKTAPFSIVGMNITPLRGS